MAGKIPRLAGNARLLAAAFAAVLGAAILSGSVAAQALPGDALLIEHWDGKKWTVTPAPVPPAGGSELSAVTAISPTDIWAVGSLVETTGTTPTWHPLAEHYDGVSWSPVVLPTPKETEQSGLVAVSGSSATDVWAVGSVGDRSLVEHYDGTSWKVVPGLRTAGSELAGVAAVSPSDVWAVGATVTKTGKTRTLIERWDGSAWRSVPSPNPSGPKDELSAISAWSARNIYAVGDYRFRGHTRALTLHWNGTRWRNRWSPSAAARQSALRGLTVTGRSDAWAVGSSRGAGGERSLTEYWHICSWHYSEVPGANDFLDLYAVSALSADDVWAVGSSGDAPQTLAEHWDGAWTVKKTPNPQIPGVLRGVAAVADDDVWAVGSSNAP